MAKTVRTTGWRAAVILLLVVLPGAARSDELAPVSTPSILATPESLAAWNYELSDDEHQLLDRIQQGCFQYFWQEVGEPGKLAKDKTSDTVCSTAAVGFQLSSLPIGVERGWISRGEGERRAMTVLRTLVQRTDNKKYGIYLHYVDERHGGLPDFTRTRHAYELQASTVDHALLQAGAMTVATYFGGEVARLVDEMVVQANWRTFQDPETGYLTFGWRADTPQGVDGPGSQRPWFWQRSSDEERLIYFLAVGAPQAEYAIEPEHYYRLERNTKNHTDQPPYVVSWNGSLFTYFFSHCWIAYRHLGADSPEAFQIDAPAVDWFENSRRAMLAHRARCIEASAEFPTLSENRWGLAPCSYRDKYLVQEVQPNLSEKDIWHDGVIAPYGAGSAIMFTPEESLAALREYISLSDDDGTPLVWRDPKLGGYGLVDSFTLEPRYGHEVYLGIDQGPMLLAIENVRSGLIWKLFMEHPVARNAVERLRLSPRGS